MWLKAHTDEDSGAVVCNLLGFSGGLFGSEHGDLEQVARMAGPPQILATPEWWASCGKHQPHEAGKGTWALSMVPVVEAGGGPGGGGQARLSHVSLGWTWGACSADTLST